MSVLDMMTPEQRERSKESMAMQQVSVLTHPMGSHPIRSTGHSHMVMEMVCPEEPIIPSVSNREARLRFIFEEFLELCDATGFQLQIDVGDGHGTEVWATLTEAKMGNGEVRFNHIEGSRYDVVESADALSDLNVFVNGTGVEWGLPLHVTDHEVYCSNLTKLDSEGKPIKNGITEGYREGESGYRADLPVGKWLKPAGFVKANIPAALVAFERKEF